jgi:hypothetical protein
MENEQLITDLKQIIERQTAPAPATADPQTLLQTALAAYQTARADGLCHEGAWEIALQTLYQESQQ